MDLNSSVIISSLKESIDLLSSLIGGIIVALFGILAWYHEKQVTKRTTLYLPLLLACRNMIEVVKNHEKLGVDLTRNLYSTSAKTLDEIVYTHGSIIYLTRGNDLNAFLSMKKTIDENQEFVEKKHWDNLKEKFKSEEFIKVKGYADILLLRCLKEVKEFKKIQG